MTYLIRPLAVALLMAPAALLAQDAAAPQEAQTCAAFLELDDAGRTQAWKDHAAAVGMDAAAAEEQATEKRVGDMATFCEVDPTVGAADAFQNSLDDPG